MNRLDRITELADMAEAHHGLIGIDIADYRHEVLQKRTKTIDMGAQVIRQGERIRLMHDDEQARVIGQGVLFTKRGGETWQEY